MRTYIVAILIFYILNLALAKLAREEETFNCKPSCFEGCLNKGISSSNLFLKEVAKYLLYVQSLRHSHSSKGTAYAFDLTTNTAWHKNLQLDLGASAALVTPAKNECNPFFLAGHTQAYYSGVDSYSQLRWQCHETCAAATDIFSLQNNFFPENGIVDLLEESCDVLRTYSMFHPQIRCQPTRYSEKEMLLVFYNSPDQFVIPNGDCFDFNPRVAAEVSNGNSQISGFTNIDFKEKHVDAANWMRNCLMKSCCPKWRNPQKDEKQVEKKEIWNIKIKGRKDIVSVNGVTFRELVEKYPGKKKVADFEKEKSRLGSNETIVIVFTDGTQEQE